MIVKPKAGWGDVRTFGVSLSFTKGLGFLIDIELWKYEFRWIVRYRPIGHESRIPQSR